MIIEQIGIGLIEVNGN